MGTSASGAATARTRTIIAALAAFALTLGLAPMAALGSESVAGPFAGPGYEGDARSASADSDLPSAAEDPTLASTLAGTTTSIVSADVALDAAEPVVGSFTADGLTYAVGTDGLTLVAVDASAVSDDTIAVPATVDYNGTTYDVTAVGAFAFYLSGATSVELPASVLSVDDRAFRSSDVGRVDVAPDNPNLASFDGCLYDSQLTSLLLIPEGRAGSVPIPSEAEVVEASSFSHCFLVDAISVDGDGAAFLSWDGLLYDASGTTLLRVPAGATEITIRDGCTTIAAGAMEGCAKLERINAPASVTSISPDLFESVLTVTLSAQMAVQDGTTSGVASSLLDQANESADSAPQLTSMVALSTANDGLPEADPASIMVNLPDGAARAPWERAGFAIEGGSSEDSLDGGASDVAASDEPDLPVASLGTAETYNGAYDITITNASGSTLYQTNASGTTSTEIASNTIGCNSAAHTVSIAFRQKSGAKGLILDMWHYAEGHSYYYWVKPGYVLTGVKITGSDGTSETLSTSTVGTAYAGTIKGKSRTITPIFEKVTYKVTLNNQSATTAGTSSVDVQYGSAMSAITLPTKEGHVFMGYFASTNGSGTKYYNADGTSAHVWDQSETYPTSLSTSVTLGTLYAYWMPEVRVFANGHRLDWYKRVTENNYGSTATPSSGYISGNQYLSLPAERWHSPFASAMTVDGVLGSSSKPHGEYHDIYGAEMGWSIVGWRYGSAGSTAETATTNVVTNNGKNYTGSAWIYPVWEPNVYKVSLDRRGGTGGTGEFWLKYAHHASAEPSCATVLYDLIPPARAGYSFAGYFTEPDGKGSMHVGADGRLLMANTAYAQGTTLYAHWTPTTLTYQPGDGATTRALDFKRTYGSGTFTDEYLGEATFAGSKALGVWALWTDPGNFQIFTGEDGNPQFFTVLQPSRAGYKLVGWKLDGAQLEASKFVTLHANRTLEPVWEPNIYKVSLDRRGGTGGTGEFWLKYANHASAEPSCATILYDLIPPARAGYSFAGYFTEPDGKGSMHVGADGRLLIGNTAYVQDTTLYAHWTPNVYRIALDKQGGLGGVSAIYRKTDVAYFIDEGCTTPWAHADLVATRAGYSFAGYFAEPDGKGIRFSWADGQISHTANNLPLSDLTAYAAWEAVALTYKPAAGTVTSASDWERTWDAQGIAHDKRVSTSSFEGSESFHAWGIWAGTDNFQVFKGQDGNPQLFVQLLPTRSGYKLVGWMLNGRLLGDGEWLEVHASGIIEPVWEPNIYKVSLDRRGGTGGTGEFWLKYASHASAEPSCATVLYDLTPPTRAGYSFAGYFTEPDGKGSMHVGADGRLLIGNTAYAQDTTLYAHWTINPVTVHANGHELSWDWAWRESGSAPVTKTGSGKVAADGSHTVESTRYYATDRNALCVDEIIPYSWFHFRGDVPGWTCVGFNTDPAASEGLPFAYYSDSVDLYAIWHANSYVVSFDANGGAGGQSASVTATFGSGMPAISTDAPTRAGYTFAGWYDASEASGGTQYYAADGTSAGNWDKASDATLYARWTGNMVNLTWNSNRGEPTASTAQVYADGVTIVLPEVPSNDPGWAFMGWWTAEEGGDEVTDDTPLPTDNATFYAHWSPVVSADVPIEVTARVDLLGLEEQVEASGYIESRCGEALKVAQVDFEPLSGASELFGSRAADVALEALVAGGEGQWWASQPVLRFPLNGKGGAVGNGDRLAAFDMASYGTHVPIGYRFDIPDDVLASIDPARFSDVTTPVGQVVYTVALAS